MRGWETLSYLARLSSCCNAVTFSSLQNLLKIENSPSSSHFIDSLLDKDDGTVLSVADMSISAIHPAMQHEAEATQSEFKN